jgi:ubiquinone biosynthesis O-methyltransferase
MAEQADTADDRRTEPELRRRLLALGYGLGCHTLFAVGVGAMIVAMYFGMSRSIGRVPAPWRLLANALLLLQFPLVHSLLLTRPGGAVLKRLAPRAVSASMSSTSYALVASVQVLALFALWTPSGVIWWRAGPPLLWVMVALYATSWLLLGKSIWDAGPALQTGFLGWWSVFKDRPPAYPPMPTKGLFRLVRQPIYVAFALTLWTVPTWTPDQLTVALALTGYCLGGPLLKERRFSRRFGDRFKAYAAQVPYWSPWPRPIARRGDVARRNDLSIYREPVDWWSGDIRWLRVLRNMVPARLAFFDPIVGDWRDKVVLDLGCGGGFMAAALAERGARVWGIDISETAIAAASRHAAANSLPIDYCVGDGVSLPYPDHSFDIVVCVDVFEHVENLGRMLAEIHRVLRPGGRLLFDTINGTRLAAFVMVTIGEAFLRLAPRGAHDPALFVRPRTLAKQLGDLGFEVGDFAGMGPRGLNRRLDVTFGRLPTLAIQYLGQARAPRPSRDLERVLR